MEVRDLLVLLAEGLLKGGQLATENIELGGIVMGCYTELVLVLFFYLVNLLE